MADDDAIQAIRAARRVCFFANYHADAIVADHVLFYLAAIRAAGFAIVFVSTSPLPPAEVAKLDGLCADVILRENKGLDFGSWITAVERHFPIRADLLLLANDSVYAPVGDLAAYVDRLVSVEADFYGAVRSEDLGRHLQSWFVLLRPQAYNSPQFRTLMRFPMVPTATKQALIETYELGLTRRLTAGGLRYHASFSSDDLTGFAARHPFNYAHILWKRLIEHGVPFLKIELVRQNPFRVTDVAQWRDVVGRLAPALVPLIEADVARRGSLPMRRWSEMEEHPQLFWPEVRFLLRREGSARGGALLFGAITAVTRRVRRLDREARRLVRRRGGRA